MGAPSTAAANRARNSSWTSRWAITGPSEVQRSPAVPKPLNRAPSRARSRSAAVEVAEAGPDLVRAGEPDLVDQAGLQGRGQAVEGGRPVGLDQVQRPVGEAGVPAQLGQGLGGGGGALGAP